MTKHNAVEQSCCPLFTAVPDLNHACRYSYNAAEQLQLHCCRTVVHSLIYYLNLMYLHTGGLADGATAGIVIGAVIFVILHLILIGVIVYYIRLRSKNQKSTNIVCENNNTSDGDRQAEYHQLERSHSYAQPLDAVAPKDSTHSDNQSNTVSQENDRRRFLKRGVRRIFARGCTIFFFKTVVDKTITIL